MQFDENILKIIEKAEERCKDKFAKLERTALFNQNKVLNAFSNNNIGQRHFAQTNGYGYDDIGRDTLCKVFAEVFGAEAAIVSPLIVSGTHALTIALYGILRPGDEMLAVSGAPYDTLKEVITGDGIGSLKDFGVSYRQVDLVNGAFDYDAIKRAISDKTKLVFVGRSRGYEWRDALDVREIGKMAKFVKELKNDVVVMCDNCYGEFVDTLEPTEVGADIAVGSMITNIGGGIAPSGGYVCGKKSCVEQIAYRLTSPSIGMEVGSYAYGYREFYQGLFLAPHVTLQALKGSVLFGEVFNSVGYKTMPRPDGECKDIIRSIMFDTEEELITFCRAVQKASPVDSNVTPFPWDMPGYEHQVIMAAGTFVAGASIELSADSPIKAPYIAYLQGGLTYEHVKIAAAYCLESVLNNK